MESNEESSGAVHDPIEGSRSAINSLVLDYYKKFGRKRDLEQYFSLSTAQSDIRDPSSIFWRRMKAQNDSSDSGEKKSESSTELCRISIKCSVVEPSTSQCDNSRAKSDSESPPIITEVGDEPDNVSKHSDNESFKSEDNNSQKSIDAALDTSINKILSPSSSITSQRKLEWDSLADVGYANESDRKTSASSLSTLERLALKQQYSNSDTNQDPGIGPPTAHSTLLDQSDNKAKERKGAIKKITKISNKDTEYLELQMPQASHTNPSSTINVNLSKHISFNVQQDGGITVEDIKKDVSISPEKDAKAEVRTAEKIDREMQTSLIKSPEIAVPSSGLLRVPSLEGHRAPITIHVNNFKSRTRKKKYRSTRRKVRKQKELEKNKENVPVLEKSADQVSEAESFEYMPGHMYNQNQMKNVQNRSALIGNKSSLESSGGAATTDSSKASKHSFTKDLEKAINLLKITLNKHGDDQNIKKKLVKDVIQRLLKSRYRDDDSTTDFLSGLSFSSKKLGLDSNHTTTSTSDPNNTGEKPVRQKKSILRVDKFRSSPVASTSQSVPNLPTVSNSDNPVISNFSKQTLSSHTESDVSSRDKNSSGAAEGKTTSSEELYQKYIQALKREEAYKKHLREKEIFLKQKLASQESTIKIPSHVDVKSHKRLRDMLKDLTRNNYDDGSGDASKLEGGSNSHENYSSEKYPIRKPRSHSVFTLSSDNSEYQKRKVSKSKPRGDLSPTEKPTTSKECGCSNSKNRVQVTDSSVQVNIDGRNFRESPRNAAISLSNNEAPGNIKYVCVCTEKKGSREAPENFLIYKCSRVINDDILFCETPSKTSSIHCNDNTGDNYESDNARALNPPVSAKSSKYPEKPTSKSSQTDIYGSILRRSIGDPTDANKIASKNKAFTARKGSKVSDDSLIIEATRWIQTEISIDPKISDPSLTDIEIMNDDQTAKLISHQYKKAVPSLNSEDLQHEKEQMLLNMDSGPSKSEINEPSSPKYTSTAKDHMSNKGSNEENYNKPVVKDEGIQPDHDYFSCDIENLMEAENVKIPIKGTNMTLMVSLGTNTSGTPTSIDAFQKMLTDNKVNRTEKGTSLSDECSKCVQSENFNQNNNMVPEIAPDNDNVSDYDVNSLLMQTNSKSCFVNPCLTDNKFQYNTYPKNTEVNIRKLQRSNTDTPYLQCYFDSDNIETEDIKVKKFAPISCEIPPLNFQSEADFSGLVSQEQTCRNEMYDNQCQNLQSAGREPSYSYGYGYVNPCQNYANPCQNADDLCISAYKNVDLRDFATQCCPTVCQPPPPAPPKECVKPKRPERLSPDRYYGRLDVPKKKAPPPKPIPPKQPAPKLPPPKPQSPKKPRAPLVKKAPEVPKKVVPTSVTVECQCDIPKPVSCECEVQVSSHFQMAKSCECEKPEACKCKMPNLCNCEVTDQCNCKPEVYNSIPETRASCNCEIPEQCKCANPQVYNCAMPKVRSCLDSRKRVEIIESTCCDSESDPCISQDPILSMIEDITKKYSKRDFETNKRKKCFKEIITILNYLLDTDEDTDNDRRRLYENNKDDVACGTQSPCTATTPGPSKVDIGIQLSARESKHQMSNTESSCLPLSSELPNTSSDSATCKVLNKIKKQCERYHQSRCKSYNNNVRRCDASSTTTANCGTCKRSHHCLCKSYKCKAHRPKTVERIKKKSVAYNLIIQTSDSMVSEEMTHDKKAYKQLKNIIVKVPPKRRNLENVPFKELCNKLQNNLTSNSPRSGKKHRSRSLPNSDVSSTEDLNKKSTGIGCTVREYLEKNRPDFVEKCSQRQDCMKIISEKRPNPRDANSPQLKMIVVHTPECMGCADACTMYCDGGVQMTCNPCPYMQGVQTDVTRIGEPYKQVNVSPNVNCFHCNWQGSKH